MPAAATAARMYIRILDTPFDFYVLGLKRHVAYRLTVANSCKLKHLGASLWITKSLSLKSAQFSPCAIPLACTQYVSARHLFSQQLQSLG
jgi:hypothetical protein